MVDVFTHDVRYFSVTQYTGSQSVSVRSVSAHETL